WGAREPLLPKSGEEGIGQVIERSQGPVAPRTVFDMVGNPGHHRTRKITDHELGELGWVGAVPGMHGADPPGMALRTLISGFSAFFTGPKRERGLATEPALALQAGLDRFFAAKRRTLVTERRYGPAPVGGAP